MPNDTPQRPMGSMHALRVDRGGTAATLQSVDIPGVEANDVLIRVHSAILAPDVFKIVETGKLPQAPTTLGHKVAGTVAAVGSSVLHIQTGQRVRLDPNLSCSNCVYCSTDRDQLCSECGVMGFFALESFPKWEQYHNGGLADFVRAPATQVDLLPDDVSFEAGAKVHDLANAVRALKNANITTGSTVLVTAPTGAMGTAVINVAPYFGISRLILVGRSTERLNAVARLTDIGCDCIGLDSLDETWTTDEGLARKVCEVAPAGFDAVIDFSPTGADLWQVFAGLRLNGTFVHMGGNWTSFPIPARVIGLKAWRIVGSRNHSQTDSRIVMDLLRGGKLKVDKLVTHEYKLEDVDSAIKQLKNRDQASWMIVVRP